jgi:hypothetical protein
MSRYARKRDETHAPIRDGLRKLGFWVADTADCPGFVDLVVWRGGVFHLLEVKREKGSRGGGGGRLTDSQEKLIASCPGQIHVVRTLDEALEAIGAKERT